MRVTQWKKGNGLCISVVARDSHSSTTPSYGYSSAWVPDTDYRGRTVHVCITPRQQEVATEDGRVTRACLGIEFIKDSPVLHVVVQTGEEL